MLARKRSGGLRISTTAVILIAGVTLRVSCLRPATPSRATVWADEVRRGPSLSSTRGAARASEIADIKEIAPCLIFSLVWTISSLDRGTGYQLRYNEPPELLPGTLYMLILRTLARGPLHGYAIARRIQESSGEGLEIEDGSLYPALHRMVVKGWLTSEWGISENNRKARFYRLTPEGRKQLERERKEFKKLIQAIQLVMRTA